MHLSRIASEDSQALASSRGSMILYRLTSYNDADSDHQALLPPRPFSAVRASVASSGESVWSLSSDSKYPSGTLLTQRGALVPYAYDPATDDRPGEDDALHDPLAPSAKASVLGWRGFFNISALILLVGALLVLFIGYPVMRFVWHPPGNSVVASANTAANANGLLPVSNPFAMPQLVDAATPASAKSITGTDGNAYDLVFSDEFETPGRSFYPGDDPYWEAVDLWYGATKDLEWYDPSMITTRGGALIVTMNNTGSHGLTYTSGMLQSWNKFCFTTGYLEMGIVFPGPNWETRGYWPGAWTMGNLGRPGYGGTTDGMWPYTYDSCDVGTFPNQTWANGTGPAAALHSDFSRSTYNFDLSWLPGQRTSACTCSGEDHPGPSNNVGRGAPEIDILEQEHNKTTGSIGGVISQSMQIAPFTHDYLYGNATQDQSIVYNSTISRWNTYRGSAVQQALSQLTTTPEDGFQGFGANPHKYGFEYWSDPKDTSAGYVTWVVDGTPTGRVGASAIGPDPLPTGSGVGQRLISVEPMSIIINLGISQSWQTIDTTTMIFPAELRVEYVRLYQRKGQTNLGCDPSSFPTMDYITRHADVYSNPNLTSWTGDPSFGGAGKTRPKNSAYDGC
ncbi:beta-glucan synthesis-associated [Vararia minispora EC-137]|uniref:Beta-glucan synthesis-associated n=1 Tax=Vararia minispora EC-137 TaxID=1314806 RepID=A0ACB8QX85_9AGAM|nr:beta-glucan synthesis-associated [Vararia minispora EC-137]